MATSRQPGLRVSEYLLEERIGEGAFAEVWRARHHIWESERVAVKLPTEPEYVRYLQREGVMVHGLRHPNIVRVLGLDPYADVPYMVMELIRGPSLKQVLQKHEKGLPIEPAITVLRGVLAAMSAAHAAGVLHRDLKPGNVLLDLNGRPLGALGVEHVKVGDFGLGLADTDALRAIAQSASLARSDRLVGTLAYMAPELRDASPEQVPDARSDLYSIGVMLFEMLTGQRPAGAELPSTLRGEVPPGLDEVFRRLYAHRDRRYPDSESVLRDLDARLGSGAAPSSGGELPPLPSLDESSRRSRRCPACGEVPDPYDQFCTLCGQQLVGEVRRCPACGSYPGPEDRFCILCGARLPALQG
jgi:serine/threonine protein kinase